MEGSHLHDNHPTKSDQLSLTPDVPVIIATGETREECEQLMAEAIPLHIESLLRDRAERPWLYTPDQLSPELRALFARIDAA